MSGRSSDEEERSVILDKAEIPFLDFEEEKSACGCYFSGEGAPVIVSAPFPFVNGKPQLVIVGETVVDLITVNNTTAEPVDLWSVYIFVSNPPDSFNLSLTKPPADSNADRELYRKTHFGGQDASSRRDIKNMVVLQNKRHRHEHIYCEVHCWG